MRPPLPRPAQVRDCLCFEEHLLNSYKVAVKVAAMKADDPEGKRKKKNYKTADDLIYLTFGTNSLFTIKPIDLLSVLMGKISSGLTTLI